MSLEALVYLLLSSALASLSQILSGIKNGAFYAKDNWIQTGGTRTGHPNPGALVRMIVPYVQNLHKVETPSWYGRFGSYYFLLLLALRYHHHFDNHFWICAGIALVMTMSLSGIASKTYQCYINVGSGLPCVDATESKVSEFALFGLSIKWNRPFSGRARVLERYISIVCFIAAVSAGFYFIH